MGLLHILKKLKHKEKQVRLLMLGLDNAGKTTVVNKFSGKPTDTICPTLGFHICSLEYRGYCLNIWDVGGQQTIRSYWRNYFEQTDGLVWVIDSADTRRLLECRDQLRSLLKEERLSGASLLVLANKQDLKGALDETAIAELLELEKIVSHHWHIEAVSAVTGEGLQKGIDWLVADIASRIFLLD